MANEKNPIKKEAAPENVMVNQIIIRPIDRSSKDIGDYRTAQRQAEAVVHANRVRLYDLYSDIEDDGHLTGITEKRISSVRNKTLHFTRDGKRVDELKDLIKSKAFRDLIKKIMESIYWGISGVEFIPGKKFKWKEIPRKHIKPQLKLIAKEQHGEEGFEYESNPWLWIIGEEDDLGLYLKCAPYAIYKRGNVADWAQYIEIFGQPVRVIKYDAYDQKTKIELQQVLDESGSSLALMIPKQADFDMKDGKQSNGDGQLQDRFKSAMNEEMSVIILGVTETTTSSKSSGYAQSETHQKQQNELTKDDMSFVENLLNEESFLNVLASYGFPVQGGRFEFENEKDLNFLRMRKEIDDWASKKVPISDEYIYETYGIPKPENYEELRVKMDEMLQSSLAGKSLANAKAEKEGQPPAAPAKQKKPTDKKSQKELEDQADQTLSLFDKFRLALSDFFGQALKD